MSAGLALKAFWWLVAKDFVAEFRGRRAWPAMLLLGLVVVVLLAAQVNLPAEYRLQVVSGLLWLGVFFAGTLALEGTFAGEREDGCWRVLLLYPLPPAVLYLAKVAVNVAALTLLEFVLIPALAVFADAPVVRRPLALALVALMGNTGFAAVGVLVSALTSGLPRRGGALALLLLPLAMPVLLAAAEATRLLATAGFTGDCANWVQLLAVFDVLFVTVGVLVFEFVVED